MSYDLHFKAYLDAGNPPVYGLEEAFMGLPSFILDTSTGAIRPTPVTGKVAERFKMSQHGMRSAVTALCDVGVFTTESVSHLIRSQSFANNSGLWIEPERCAHSVREWKHLLPKQRANVEECCGESIEELMAWLKRAVSQNGVIVL